MFAVCDSRIVMVQAYLIWVRALSWPARRMGLMLAVCVVFFALVGLGLGTR